MSENEKLIDRLEKIHGHLESKFLKYESVPAEVVNKLSHIISELKSPTKVSLEKCAEAVVQMAFDNKTEALHDQLAKDIAKVVLDAAGVDYE